MESCRHIKKEKIKVGEHSSGEVIYVNKWLIEGSEAGAPKVYIQASMHASEIQGNAVVFELLTYLKENQPQGDIVIIPQCNPISMSNRLGAGHQGRFDPATGDNWNRHYFLPEIDYEAFAEAHLHSETAIYKAAFRQLLMSDLDAALACNYRLSRAKRLNYIMQRQALEADIILDLHTDTNAIDYIYSPNFAKQSVEKFYFSYVLLMENDVGGALDEAGFYPWWALKKAFEKHKRQEEVQVDAFTLELGSEEIIDSKKGQNQALGILNYLAYKGVVKSIPTVVKRVVSFHDVEGFQSISASHGGLYEWFVQPGESVKRNQVIGQCLQTDKQRKIEVTLPFDARVISINAQGALPQSAHIMNVVKC